MKKYEVYIIISTLFKRYYIGQTHNFKERLIRHNKGLVKSTKYGIPWELKLKIEVLSRSEAIILEIKRKKRGAKRYLEDNNSTLGV